LQEIRFMYGTGFILIHLIGYFLVFLLDPKRLFLNTISVIYPFTTILISFIIFKIKLKSKLIYRIILIIIIIVSLLNSFTLINYNNLDKISYINKEFKGFEYAQIGVQQLDIKQIEYLNKYVNFSKHTSKRYLNYRVGQYKEMLSEYDIGFMHSFSIKLRGTQTFDYNYRENLFVYKITTPLEKNEINKRETIPIAYGKNLYYKTNFLCQTNECFQGFGWGLGIRTYWNEILVDYLISEQEEKVSTEIKKGFYKGLNYSNSEQNNT